MHVERNQRKRRWLCGAGHGVSHHGCGCHSLLSTLATATLGGCFRNPGASAGRVHVDSWEKTLEILVGLALFGSAGALERLGGLWEKWSSERCEHQRCRRSRNNTARACDHRAYVVRGFRNTNANSGAHAHRAVIAKRSFSAACEGFQEKFCAL
jgi:hypothetical protein